MHGKYPDMAEQVVTAEKEMSTSKRSLARPTKLSNLLRRRVLILMVSGTVVCACAITALCAAVWALLSLGAPMAAAPSTNGGAKVVYEEIAHVRAFLSSNEAAVSALLSNARDARDAIPALIDSVSRTIQVG